MHLTALKPNAEEMGKYKIQQETAEVTPNVLFDLNKEKYLNLLYPAATANDYISKFTFTGEFNLPLRLHCPPPYDRISHK